MGALVNQRTHADTGGKLPADFGCDPIQNAHCDKNRKIEGEYEHFQHS